MFECSFANKFLYNKFNYEYEKPYNDGTKRKCDFYVPILNLWIECSYNELVDTFAYQSIKDSIPLNVSYYDKERVKKIGGRWNPDKKYWYIPMELNTGNRLKKFEEFMYERHLKIIESDKPQITENYSSDLRKKILDNTDKRIIVVSNSELDSCNSLDDVLRVCDNEYYKQLISEEKIKTKEKIQSYKKPNESDLQLALRFYMNLQSGDKHRFIQSINKQSKQKPKRKKLRNKKNVRTQRLSQSDKQNKRKTNGY